MRKVVRMFANQMERRLRANDHKRGWGQCSEDYLIRKLSEEFGELLIAIRVGRSTAVTHEAADLANIAMMIADNFGALDGGTDDE